MPVHLWTRTRNRGAARPLATVLAVPAAPAVLIATMFLAGCGPAGVSPSSASSVTASSSGSAGSGSASSSPSASAGTTDGNGTASASASGAANGIDRLSPTEALARARAAFVAAPSARVSGTFTWTGTKVSLDAQLKGNQGRATVSLPTGSVGTVRAKPGSPSPGAVQTGTFGLLTLSSATYLWGNKAFWTQTAGGAMASALAGKYVRIGTADAQARKLNVFVNRAQLIDTVFPAQGLGSGRVGTLNGQRVYVLSDAAGRTLDLALSGPPYPLQFSSGQGLLTFRYGVPVDLSLPAGATVLDSSKGAVR